MVALLFMMVAHAGTHEWTACEESPQEMAGMWKERKISPTARWYQHLVDEQDWRCAIEWFKLASLSGYRKKTASKVLRSHGAEVNAAGEALIEEALAAHDRKGAEELVRQMVAVGNLIFEVTDGETTRPDFEAMLARPRDLAGEAEFVRARRQGEVDAALELARDGRYREAADALRGLEEVEHAPERAEMLYAALGRHALQAGDCRRAKVDLSRSGSFGEADLGQAEACLRREVGVLPITGPAGWKPSADAVAAALEDIVGVDARPTTTDGATDYTIAVTMDWSGPVDETRVDRNRGVYVADENDCVGCAGLTAYQHWTVISGGWVGSSRGTLVVRGPNGVVGEAEIRGEAPQEVSFETDHFVGGEWTPKEGDLRRMEAQIRDALAEGKRRATEAIPLGFAEGVARAAEPLVGWPRVNDPPTLTLLPGTLDPLVVRAEVAEVAEPDDSLWGTVSSCPLEIQYKAASPTWKGPEARIDRMLRFAERGGPQGAAMVMTAWVATMREPHGVEMLDALDSPTLERILQTLPEVDSQAAIGLTLLAAGMDALYASFTAGLPTSTREAVLDRIDGCARDHGTPTPP